jgi:uncharacterized protein YegJ (DUF2314 family)
MNYDLANVEEAAARAPDTFRIPPRAVREAQPVGAYVKLIFRLLARAADGCEGERMWVRIREVEAGRYAGTLENDPTHFAPELLKIGERVEFGPEHIASVE